MAIGPEDVPMADATGAPSIGGTVAGVSAALGSVGADDPDDAVTVGEHAVERSEWCRGPAG